MKASGNLPDDLAQDDYAPFGKRMKRFKHALDWSKPKKRKSNYGHKIKP